MHRLLLDENLSPWVGLQLRHHGRDVVHVRERGLLGEPDHVVIERVFEEERVLITAKVGGFVKLASARDLHVGLILLEDGALLRDEQLELLVRV